MIFHRLILLLATSTLFVGCNEDTPSSRIKRSEEPQTKVDLSIYSGIHREKGTAPLTYNDEIALGAQNTLLRLIPDIRFDDEGGDGKNVLTRSELTRPSLPCGLEATATLAQKIADCVLKEKNGVLASWNGTSNATSAEGVWSLVSLIEGTNGGKAEIWLDGKTGMVWSDIIDEEANWCEASGNQLMDSDEVGLNCATLSKGQSLCTNYDLPEVKGITWRLPTRHDYLQADLDGIRFVLKTGKNIYWTATTSTEINPRTKAWAYNMRNGALTGEAMSTSRHLRCIGTPKF